MTSDTELKAAVERIARIIDPKAWKKFDRNAGSYAAHVTEEDRRAWDRHFVEDSLDKATAILAALPSLQQGAGITDAMVEDAMTDAWSEICNDTGCHPLDIVQLGRKRIMFKPHHWAALTAMRLRGLMLAASPPTPASVGAAPVKMLVDADWLTKRVATDPDACVEAAIPVPAVSGADPLTWLAQHQNHEVTFSYGDEDEDAVWRVHRVNGGVNDREWTEVGRGATPEAAIRRAMIAAAPSPTKDL